MVNQKIKREMELSEKFYTPAIKEFRENGVVSITHPDTGEFLIVEELPDIGNLIVKTKKLGILMRVKYKPR